MSNAIHTKKSTVKAALSKSAVSFYLHGATSNISPVAFTSPKLIEAVRLGLAIKELQELQASLAVPMEELRPLLGMSKATLHRRMAEGRLRPDESDRVLRFARLMGKAIEVLEGETNARKWLNSPQYGLGGAVPLAYAETEVGAREVEDLLGRIEYGVYS